MLFEIFISFVVTLHPENAISADAVHSLEANVVELISIVEFTPFSTGILNSSKDTFKTENVQFCAKSAEFSCGDSPGFEMTVGAPINDTFLCMDWFNTFKNSLALSLAIIESRHVIESPTSSDSLSA